MKLRKMTKNMMKKKLEKLNKDEESEPFLFGEHRRPLVLGNFFVRMDPDDQNVPQSFGLP